MQSKILEYQHLNVIDGATYISKSEGSKYYWFKSHLFLLQELLLEEMHLVMLKILVLNYHGQDHLKLTWTPPSAVI